MVVCTACHWLCWCFNLPLVPGVCLTINLWRSCEVELSLNNFPFLPKFQLVGQVGSGERFVRTSGLSSLTWPPASRTPGGPSPTTPATWRGGPPTPSPQPAWYRGLISVFKVISRTYQLGQKLARLIITFSVMSEFFFSSPPPWLSDSTVRPTPSSLVRGETVRVARSL